MRRWREGEPITRSSSVRQSAGHEPFTALQRRISALLPRELLSKKNALNSPISQAQYLIYEKGKCGGRTLGLEPRTR